MIKSKKKKNQRIAKIKPINKKRFSFKKLIFWFLLLCFFAVAFWILLLSPYTEVKSIEITADNFEREKIENIVDGETAGKYFEVFSKKNFFLFPKKRIIEKAVGENRLLEKIEIKRKFPSAIKIYAKGRENVFIWMSREKYFLIDRAGNAFWELDSSQADEFGKQFAIIKDEGGRSVIVGENVMSEDLARFFFEAISFMRRGIGMEFRNEMATSSLLSDKVRLFPEEGWTLYLGTGQSLEKQLAALKAFFEKHLTPQEAQKLEYVDLSLKGRISYKIKAENKEETADDEELVN